MKFLYVHAWDFKAIKDCGFNLDSDARFEFKEGRLVRTSSKKLLPQNFFSLQENTTGRVEDVSVICGANGSGKTTVAAALASIISGVAPTESSLLAVVEVSHGICEIHYMGPRFASNEYVASVIGFDNNGIPCKCIRSYPRIVQFEKDGKYSLSRRCDFVYYSPLFTSERVITGDGWKPGNAFSIYDCSTTAQYDLITSNDIHIGNTAMLRFRAHERVSAFRMLWELRQKGLDMSFSESDAPTVSLKLQISGEHIIGAVHHFDKDAHLYQFNEGIRMDEVIRGIQYNIESLFNPSSSVFEYDDAYYVYAAWIVNQLMPAIGQGGEKRIREGTFYYDLVDKAYDMLDESRGIEDFLSDNPENEDLIPQEIRLIDANHRLSLVAIGRLLRLVRDKRLSKSSIKDKKTGNWRIGWELNCGSDDDVAFACELLAACAQSDLSDYYLEVKVSPELSSGAAAYLLMWSRLNWYFLGAQEDSRRERFKVNHDVVIFMDEAETALHPMWQRELVRETIRFCEMFGVGRKIHLVFGTHSPMILSDIPRDNTVCLQSKERQIQVVDGIEGWNTFGANIFDLYRSSFFLEQGTVGAFAQEKINKALKEVASVVKKSSRTHKTAKIKKELLQVLNLIGDGNLLKYLADLKGAKLI